MANVWYSDRGTPSSHETSPGVQRIEIPLTFDNEFFDILHNDVQQLDTIQDTEKAALTKEIEALSDNVAEMSKPHKFGKSDMYQWYASSLHIMADFRFSKHVLILSYPSSMVVVVPSQ
jgi:E3 ubiquitin-protein ligase BAH